MAKSSSIQKNLNRRRIVKRDSAKRKDLKNLIMDKSTSFEVRFNASLNLAKLSRNGCVNRVRNRCELTGRPRGNYRKFNLSRICLRELANQGKIPGIVKSSW